MKLVKRMLLLGALAGAAPLAMDIRPAVAQEAAVGSRITEDQLGQMIAALGLQPDKKAQRYDFAFQAQMDDQKWELSMSAVLSQDGNSLWIMAWLDPLPTSSADVPRSALLQLLAQNDQLGEGKFFAYIPNNRRFVLERVLPNENLTSAQLRAALQDLGSTVVETYPIWSVSNWNSNGAPPAPTGQAQTTSGTEATQSALNESKFDEPARR